MQLQLIRHATLRLNIGGILLLVDPMLGDAASMPPIQNSANPRPNPLVPLPIPAAETFAGVDAVLVTHTHRDHWDGVATELLPHRMPIICQPEDVAKFRDWGFEDVRPIHTRAVFRHVTIVRTAGRHGTGEIGAAMAPVSGYMLRSRAGESVYIAGDTIYCSEVAEALAEHKPNYTVVNCGGARFLEGDPITMTAEDVVQVAQTAPFSRVIAVHMEAINHCAVTREDLRHKLCEQKLCDRVLIPADGETLML
jgi:L-ascorbate metabolism protein UlaG (beta-lactamase superfamily)